MNKSKLQFRIGTLMLLIVPIAIVVFFVNRHYELGKRPIDWQPLTEERLADELAEGKTVLVFFRADAIITDPHYAEMFESAEFRREFHLNGYSAMTESMYGESGMNPVLEKSGRYTNLIIYDPKEPDKSTTFPPGALLSKETILEALELGIDYKRQSKLDWKKLDALY